MTSNNKILYLSAAALLMLGFSGCSILQGKGKVVKADPSAGVDVTIWEESIPSPSAPANPGASPSDPSDKKAADRRVPADENVDQAPVVKFDTKLASALHGEWVIVAAGKTKIERDEDMPYINFDTTSGRVYAFNGCNYLNGSFSTPTENSVEFMQMISTLRMCPDATFQYDINAAIEEGKPIEVRIEKKGRESYLYFLRASKNTANANSTPILTLRRHNMESLSGQWLVKDVNGEKDGAPEANIFFDIPELRVHGNTGCNYFNGEIRIEPTQRNSVSFSRMGVTGRLCENSAFETAMLVALEQVSSYSISGNTLELFDLSGRRLMTLQRDLNSK